MSIIYAELAINLCPEAIIATEVANIGSKVTKTSKKAANIIVSPTHLHPSPGEIEISQPHYTYAKENIFLKLAHNFPL